MNMLTSKKSWLLSPVLFLVSVAVLLLVWASMSPENLRAAFDANGRSPFELMTLPLYALIVPMVWIACPFSGSIKRKVLLASALSIVVVVAILKQLDLHIEILSAFYPDVVANFKGTPFKMRFLTGAGIPLGAKLIVITYFISMFGVFIALAAYYSITLVKAVFKLHPVAWTFGCFLASGAMAQIFDRLPAWYRDVTGVPKGEIPSSILSLFTAFEEGGEMMMALFALLAVLQAHIIYCCSSKEEC